MGASEHLTGSVPSAGHVRDDELAYSHHRRQVTAHLSRRFAHLDDDELLGLYHDAWATVLKRREEGVAIAHLGAYLHATAANLASKRANGADARRRFTWDPTSAAFTGLADVDEPPDERAVAVDEARRLRLLVAELGPAEQAVLKLRIDAGLEPTEVRDQLGLSERQYRRIAERAAKALVAQFRAFDRGDWARAKRSLLSACVMGIASAAQRERARRLVAEDPCCRAMMSELRRVGAGAAALLPWPAATAAAAPEPTQLSDRLADLAAAAKERAGDLLGQVHGDGPPRTGETLGAARRQAGELVAGAKQQATSAYVRAADPTPMAGARPGAVGAVVASCVAVGGGVTYCASENINPLREFTGADAMRADERPEPKPAKKPEPRRAQAPPPSAPAPPPPATTTPQPPLQQQEPAPPATPPPATPPPSSAQEFDPGAGTAASPSTPAAPSTPAPARTGEFSGP